MEVNYARFIIGDVDGVVGEGRLEFREEQVQCVSRKGKGGTSCFNCTGPSGGSHFRPISAETSGKSRRGPNYGSRSFWELTKRAKFESFIECFVKFQKPRRKGFGQKQEVAKEWEAMEENSEVNSADQIDQLGDVRFKMKLGGPIYQVQKWGIFGK